MHKSLHSLLLSMVVLILCAVASPASAEEDSREDDSNWRENEQDYELLGSDDEKSLVQEDCELPENRAKKATATPAFEGFLSTLDEVDHHPDTRFGEQKHETRAEIHFSYLTARTRGVAIDEVSDGDTILGFCRGLEGVLRSMAVSDENDNWVADLHQLTYRGEERAEQVAEVDGGFGKHPTWKIRDGRHVYVVEGRFRAPNPNQEVVEHLEQVVKGEH